LEVDVVDVITSFVVVVTVVVFELLIVIFVVVTLLKLNGLGTPTGRGRLYKFVKAIILTM
jgi:hypothetical protein